MYLNITSLLVTGNVCKVLHICKRGSKWIDVFIYCLLHNAAMTILREIIQGVPLILLLSTAVFAGCRSGLGLSIR